jgi:hypothetical protein
VRERKRETGTIAQPELCSNMVSHMCRVGFEVLMAVSMKMAAFWVVVPCRLV